MKYCFGPVPSRRLGLSLGVDILPKKTCNLDCVYCEIGPTRKYITKRAEYTPAESIMNELKKVLTEDKVKFDCLTFTASGEPALHSRLGELISYAKQYTDKPITVLTNSTLTYDEKVRNEVCQADILLPSLDSALEPSFKKINRPAPGIELAKIIYGLEKLRLQFKGEIWLEVLLVKGINDKEEEAYALKDLLDRLRPDKIQLNTVDRPPAVKDVEPVSLETIKNFAEILGPRSEIIADFNRKGSQLQSLLLKKEIVDLLARRPLRKRDIEKLFASTTQQAKQILTQLEKDGCIIKKRFKDETFYVLKTDKDNACAQSGKINA